MRRLAALPFIALFAAGVARAGWEWPTAFTDSTAPDLATLHSEIHRLRLDDSTLGIPVANATFRADSFRVTLVEGTLFEEAPIEGVVRGAWFQGRAIVTFEPASRTAKHALHEQWGTEALRDVPVSWIYLFGLREKSPAGEIGATGEASVPWTGSPDYDDARKALRMSGLRLLHAYLNRDGRSKGAVFAVFAPETLRRKEPESHFLYAYDPNELYEVSLSVFGNAAAILDPSARRALEFDETLKYDWWRVAGSEASPPVFAPHGRVAKYTSAVSVSKGVRTAALETTVDLEMKAGAAALAFDLSPRMKVSAVALPDGTSLPFAQWKDAPSTRNLDSTVVVRLPETPPAGTRLTLTVKAEGPLFDAVLGGTRQAEEDRWKPSFNDPEGSVHELRATVPKDMRAVSAGKIVSEEVTGGERTVHFLTSRPVNYSTFYVGPFDSYEADADGVKITLLHAPAREEIAQALGTDDVVLRISDTPKYAVEEVANAVRVYTRLLGVPLDLKDLRVATTPTGHGRGFEGMILLSKYAGTRGDSSGADLFRAHEVAHQWWGGKVLSKRWPEDRWLTESFAEYMAMEYYDVRFEKPDKTLQQIREQWVNPLFMQTDAKTLTMTGEPIDIRTGEQPLTDGRQNVYTKGPLVLRHLEYLFHVLKKGDGAFWEFLHEFLEAHPYEPVTTEEFIAAAERKLGGKFDWFWNQWIYGAGLPLVRWDHAVTPHPEGGYMLTVNVRQERTDFTFPVPVHIRTGEGKDLETHLAVRGKEGGKLQVRVRERPRKISLNDEWRVPIDVRE